METKEGEELPPKELFSTSPYVPPKFDPPGPRAFSEMRAENVVYDGKPIALSQLAEKPVKTGEEQSDDTGKPAATGVKRGQRG